MNAVARARLYHSWLGRQARLPEPYCFVGEIPGRMKKRERGELEYGRIMECERRLRERRREKPRRVIMIIDTFCSPDPGKFARAARAARRRHPDAEIIPVQLFGKPDTCETRAADFATWLAEEGPRYRAGNKWAAEQAGKARARRCAGLGVTCH